MRRLCSMAVNKQLAVVGSSMHVYSVLFRLVHEAEVPQHELAYDAAIDPAAASRLIRDMTADGLVTTRVDPADKRQRFVKITAKGRTLERTLQQIVDAALEPYMVGLTESEEQDFLRLLRKAHEAVMAISSEGEEAPVRAPAKPRALPARAPVSRTTQVHAKLSPRSRSTR
ncbi:MAG: MarR family winged helix-turn-helix transcriptional regulator [Myxococcales bacterium]